MMSTITIKERTSLSESLCAISSGLLVSMVSIVTGLILLEAMLRVIPFPFVKYLEEQRSVRQDKQEVHPKGLYAIHPAIGWTLTPGFGGEFKKDDFHIHIQANADGLRDIDYGKKQEEAFRILGLGDSFAFGWGVESEQSFFKVLEKMLNKRIRSFAPPPFRRYEAINAGIPGFGTYEALALTKSVGLKYEPDLVVLAFYEGNDYKNNGDAPRKREIRDGYLADVTNEKPFFVRKITSSSVLAAFIESRMASIFHKTGFTKDFQKTKDYLLDLKSALDRKRIPLVLMFIPDQDAAVYTRSGFKRGIDRLLRGTNLLDARGRLKRFCREKGISFFWLSKEFEDGEYSASLRLKDAHFNVDGHRKAGEELYTFLAGGLLKEEVVL